MADSLTTETESIHVRKKPVEVEAWRWVGNDYMLDTAPEWVKSYRSADGNRCKPEYSYFSNSGSEWFLMIPTLEGNHYASAGDWIIKGVKGELYPCKPDIFEATYERV
jgi:hypothetical protein